MSLYESIKNNLNESSVKTQDFINDLSADNLAMRAAGISGDTMTFEQYQKYQDALHEVRKNDTSRYEITIDYWDKNWNAKDKTYVGRSLKEIAKKFVKAKENLDFEKVSDYSDNLYELLDKSDYSSIEDYLEAVAKGEVSKMSESSDDAYMEEWRSICEAFCKKIGAKLLFVNTDNFGYEDKNGNLVHMYADELESYLKNHKFNEMDTWVDPRSKVDGWKVKVLDVFPDDYAGSTVAEVETIDPEGKSQGTETIFINRQKVKIGETYDAYIDGIMACPRIKGVPEFTYDEVPDMKKVSRDMYVESDSSDSYSVYLTVEVEPGKYETSVYGTYDSAEQAEDVVNELHGRGINASVVQGSESSSDVSESDDSQLYVFHDIKSDDKEDAASYIHNFKSEAPKLSFKLSQPYRDGMWSVDFIGSKKDVEDYLVKLGYYDRDEVSQYVQPLREAEIDNSYSPFKILDHGDGVVSISLDQDDYWYDWKDEVKRTPSRYGDGHCYDDLFNGYLLSSLSSKEFSNLDFDSENGMFCVYVPDMKIARKVAGKLASLYKNESKMLDLIKRTKSSINYNFNESVEPVDLTKYGKCPYCTKDLSDIDKWFVDKYGMCKECFDNGVE